LAFDLFKQTTGSDIKLLIGGRLAWQNDTVQRTFDLSIHKTDIKFLGFIPEEDLPFLLGSALAMVYVSLFEGFVVLFFFHKTPQPTIPINTKLKAMISACVKEAPKILYFSLILICSMVNRSTPFIIR